MAYGLNFLDKIEDYELEEQMDSFDDFDEEFHTEDGNDVDFNDVGFDDVEEETEDDSWDEWEN